MRKNEKERERTKGNERKLKKIREKIQRHSTCSSKKKVADAEK